MKDINQTNKIKSLEGQIKRFLWPYVVRDCAEVLLKHENLYLLCLNC
jgi:hypothetical protein